jgi:tetratricopeptide (TPR) repeat protein
LSLVFEFNSDRPVIRWAFALILLALCLLLSVVCLATFVVGAVADPKVELSREVLAALVKYLPDSAIVHERLARAELAETVDYEVAAARAEDHASRAVKLSPWDYRLRLLLASAREARGDLKGAEESLRAALVLAPNYTEVHWRLANLLLRAGKLGQALGEFRLATSASEELVPTTLALVWRASSGNPAAVEAATNERPRARLELARFLLAQARVEEAVAIFRRIDRHARLGEEGSGAFLDRLIELGSVKVAGQLWQELIVGAASERPLIWNGGFESEIKPALAQFDWKLSSNSFARITLDTKVAHSGRRSLRVDFLGRDTTRLEKEVSQLILVRAGARYRLSCFVKTRDLVTPEGPEVVLSHPAASWTASSAPITAGSHDWQPVVFEFVAPAEASALYLQVKRVPRFSYDEPTRGTVWFDDFTLLEIGP